MKTEIMIRLFYSLIFSLVFSLVFSWTNYQATDGFESRQANFTLVILTFLFCIINFLASLTAFFNLNLKIRENIFLSASSFMAIPVIILFLLFFEFMTKKNQSETVFSFFLLSMPTISYILSLIYNFIQFRKNFKSN